VFSIFVPFDQQRAKYTVKNFHGESINIKKFRWDNGNFWRKKIRKMIKKIVAIGFLMQQIFGSIFVM
jgi:hypothetical protein